MIRVIVVEDERFLRKGLILTTPWKELGCQLVGEAGSAVEAIRLARKSRPDIVITDIRMPQMSGLDMIKAIQKEIDCEYIIISGYDEFEYAKTALGLGVKSYLVKPIDPDELVDAIQSVVKAVQKKRDNLIAAESFAYLEGKLPPLMLFAKGAGSFHDRYVNAAISFMQEHCAEELTAKNVAGSLNISDSYLSKLIKTNTGFTFLELLTNIRISQAIKLMEEDGSHRIYEVASSVGYKDTRHFSEVFKKTVGISPSEYRRCGMRP